MAWVMGIRQVTHVIVAADVEVVGLRKGPVVTKVERVIVDLSARAIAEIVGCRPMIFLPTHTGAGPCGTHARVPLARGWSSWWSIHHLLMPLRAYYATYEPPMRFGAKPGPRGRCAT